VERNFENRILGKCKAQTRYSTTTTIATKTTPIGATTTVTIITKTI
jgi:hypothetical protein